MTCMSWKRSIIRPGTNRAGLRAGWSLPPGAWPSPEGLCVFSQTLPGLGSAAQIQSRVPVCLINRQCTATCWGLGLPQCNAMRITGHLVLGRLGLENSVPGAGAEPSWAVLSGPSSSWFLNPYVDVAAKLGWPLGVPQAHTHVQDSTTHPRMQLQVNAAEPHGVEVGQPWQGGGRSPQNALADRPWCLGAWYVVRSASLMALETPACQASAAGRPHQPSLHGATQNPDPKTVGLRGPIEISPV